MKKSYRMVIVVIAVFTILFVYGKNFINVNQQQNIIILQDLTVSQVENISVYSLSTTEKVVLSEDEISDLVSKLNKVQLIDEGIKDFSGYCGIRPRMFHIELKNNTNFDFSANNPFYIINAEKCYKSDYSTCDDISNMYYSLVDEYFPKNE